jgi:hypothetical protein
VLGSVTPIGACVKAGRAEFHAALIEMDWNAEAAVVAADILGTRRIPFIFATRLWDVPGPIERAGIVLRPPLRIDEIAGEIERSMPKEIVERMNLRGRIDPSRYPAKL